MAELTGDPRCNFCRHLASSHRYESAPDASVPCAACPGGRCPPGSAGVLSRDVSMQDLASSVSTIARGEDEGMDELEAEAAQLAAESVYSREQWRHTLLYIGYRPDRLAIARTCGEAAARGGNTPYAVATLLVGDETTPGILAAYVGAG